MVEGEMLVVELGQSLISLSFRDLLREGLVNIVFAEGERVQLEE